MKRSGRTNRFTSGLLCLVMVLTMTLTVMPQTAFAMNDGTYTSNDYKVKVKDGKVTIVEYLQNHSGNITIPEYYFDSPVVAIGDNAFANCSLLTGVTIPSSVTSIGECAFTYCSSLKSITIPRSVTEIGDGAFSCCEKLKSVTVLGDLTKISNDLFFCCTELTSVSFQGRVYGGIGEFAFCNCKKLESITIPNGVTSIGISAFSTCSELANITLPNSITSIGDYAFYYCLALSSITLPDELKTIGAYAFVETALYTVVFPSKLTYIGDWAFYNIKTFDVLPPTIKHIGSCAFHDAMQTNVLFPSTIAFIGESAFANVSSFSLTGGTTTVEAMNYPSIKGGSIKMLDDSKKLIRKYNKKRLVVVQLKRPNDLIPRWTDVTQLKNDVDEFFYPTLNMTTDGDGKLYIWLEDGQTLKSITAGGREYTVEDVPYVTVDENLAVEYTFSNNEQYGIDLNVYFTDGTTPLDPCPGDWHVKTDDDYNIIQNKSDNGYNFYVTSYDDYTTVTTGESTGRYALFFTLPEGYSIKGLYNNALPSNTLEKTGFTASGGFGTTPPLYYFNVAGNSVINIFVGQEGKDVILPRFVENSLPDGKAGIMYELRTNIFYTDSDEKPDMAIEGELPRGMSFSLYTKPVLTQLGFIFITDYFFRGTPLESGVFEFDVVFSRNNIEVSRETVSLRINGTIQPLTIGGVDEDLSSFVIGERKSLVFSVQDLPEGFTALSWTIEGAIPDGLLGMSNKTNGYISGVPTTAADAPVTITVSARTSEENETVYYGTKSIQIEVNNHSGPHTFSETLSSDEDSHWYACTQQDCIAKSGFEAHSDIDDGDCTTAVICECQYIVHSAKSEHAFSDTYAYSNDDHWHACINNGCTVTSEKQAHSNARNDCTDDSPCSICNAPLVPKSEHDFTGEYQFDSSGHWHKCQNIRCTVTEAKEAHSGTDDGNCTTAVVCECGYIVRYAAISHSFGSECQYDESGHWQTCTNPGCTVTTEKQAHIGISSGEYDCTSDFSCTICDYERTGESEHNYGYQYDIYGHRGVCQNSGCTVTEEKQAHAVMDSDDNEYTCRSGYTCSVCGFSKAAGTAHEYSPGNPTYLYDESGHWVKCLIPGCTGIDAKEAHRGGNNADCTAGFTCGLCGYVMAAKSEHDFTGTYQFDSSGHWKACQNSGCTVTEEKISHSGTDDGDCTTAFICDTCNYISTAKSEHNYGEYLHDSSGHWRACQNEGCTVTEAKETHSGTDDGNCTTRVLCECGYIVRYATVSHSYGEYQYDESGHWQTCTRPGCTVTSEKQSHLGINISDCTSGFSCTVCDYERAGESGHNYGEYQYDVYGHWRACQNSGCTVTEEKQAHDEDDGNCTTELVCDTCNYISAAKFEHNYGEYLHDSSGHWRACQNEGCTVTEAKETHSGTDDGNCTTRVLCECGYIVRYATVSHSYGEYQYDESGHWQTCTRPGCTVTSEKQSHLGININDCTSGFSCTVCDYERAGESGHNYGEYQYDVYGHWRACQNSGCTVTEEKQAHNGDDGDCTTEFVCETCNYTLAAKSEHNYGEYLHDSNYHWFACQNEGCTVTEAKEAHNRTDDGDCTTRVLCECGYIVRYAAVSHSYGEYQYDESGHWQVCTRPGCTAVSTKEEHTGINISDCTSGFSCTVCDYARTAEPQHNYSYQYDIYGHWRACQNSGCTVTEEKQAHAVMNPDDKDYTCVGGYTCRVCGFSKDAGQNHVFDSVNPTFSFDESSHWCSCLIPGCTGILEKIAHTGGNDTDCTDGFTCDVCGFDVEAKSAHEFTGAYIHDSNYHWRACQNMGCTVTEAKEAHIGGTATVTERAICSVCGQPYGETLSISAIKPESGLEASGGFIIGTTPETTLSSFEACFNGSITVKDLSGDTILSDSLIGTGFTVEVGAETYAVVVSGDLDGSGSISTYDAIMLLQYVAELQTLTDSQLKAADTNKSEGAETHDAVLLLQYLAEIISEF